MNISLTPELEKFVEEEVNSGMYASRSDVMRDALCALMRQRIAYFDAAIDEALNDTRAAYTSEQFAEIVKTRYSGNE